MAANFADLNGPFRVLIISDDLSSSPPSACLLRVLQRTIADVGGVTVRWEPALVHQYPGHRPGAGSYDELRRWAEDAHCLILLTSVRNGSYSGAIKLALDNLHAAQVRRKPAGLVSIAESHHANAVDQLRVVMAALETVVIPRAVIASGGDLIRHGDHPAAASPSLLRRVRLFAEELRWFATKLRPGISVAHQVPEAAGTGVPDRPAGWPSSAGPARHLTPSIGRAVTYIRENYADTGLTLDVAARTAHMSRYHFSRIFKKQTGRRFIDFVTTVRMSQAQSLLSRTDLPVAEICRRAGYNDLSHFQRTFRTLFAVSPSEYRNRHGRRRQEPIALDSHHEDEFRCRVSGPDAAWGAAAMGHWTPAAGDRRA